MEAHTHATVAHTDNQYAKTTPHQDVNQPVYHHGWNAGGREGNRWIETHTQTHNVCWGMANIPSGTDLKLRPVHARVNLTPVSPHWEETVSRIWAKASAPSLPAPVILIRLAESLLLLWTENRGSQGQVSVPLRPVWGTSVLEGSGWLLKLIWSYEYPPRSLLEHWWLCFDRFLSLTPALNVKGHDWLRGLKFNLK